MAAATVLVIGIHREELAFGDHVAALLEPAEIDVLRIPQGVPQTRPAAGRQFHYDTRHRELYLQLQQQVKGRYRLLIDLHSGLDEGGPTADVFCHQEDVLGRLGTRLREADGANHVRPLRIIARDESEPRAGWQEGAVVGAYTWIPRSIWEGGMPVYVGLEIYLRDPGAGGRGDWQFAREVIELIHGCEGAGRPI